MNLSSILKNVVPYNIYEEIKSYKVTRQLSEDHYAEEPILLNKYGEQLRIFYFVDSIMGIKNYSFTKSRLPRYIFWDRNNASLRTHFYSHENIFHNIGKPVNKFAILIETEIIAAKSYVNLLKSPLIANEYKAIFTHSSKLLNRYTNAKFVPAGGIWYGSSTTVGLIDDKAFMKKTKNISIVSSSKTMCDLHKLRIQIAYIVRNDKLGDAYGTCDGGKYINIADSLIDYRYSIIIENTIEPYCFTEKILNCFASMTIPIYVGATNIAEYFNSNGIITIDSKKALSDIKKVCYECTEENYMSKLSYIIDNYNRVQNYICQEDYLIHNYPNYFGKLT